jgi:hypothetical protein
LEVDDEALLMFDLSEARRCDCPYGLFGAVKGFCKKLRAFLLVIQ